MAMHEHTAEALVYRSRLRPSQQFERMAMNEIRPQEYLRASAAECSGLSPGVVLDVRRAERSPARPPSEPTSVLIRQADEVVKRHRDRLSAARERSAQLAFFAIVAVIVVLANSGILQGVWLLQGSGS